MAAEWIEVGWVSDVAESERFAKAHSMLDKWLVDRGVSRASIPDEDLRIDLVYLGPGKGCDLSVSIKESALQTRVQESVMLAHLKDLETPLGDTAGRRYDPVDLVRYALSWPSDYWPGLALTWLEQGLPASRLVNDLQVFENGTHRPQAQRHRARRLWKMAGG